MTPELRHGQTHSVSFGFHGGCAPTKDLRDRVRPDVFLEQLSEKVSSFFAHSIFTS